MIQTRSVPDPPHENLYARCAIIFFFFLSLRSHSSFSQQLQPSPIPLHYFSAVEKDRKRKLVHCGELHLIVTNLNKKQQQGSHVCSSFLVCLLLLLLFPLCCYKIHMGMRNVTITVKLSLINPVPICVFFGAVSLNRRFIHSFDFLKCPPMRTTPCIKTKRKVTHLAVVSLLSKDSGAISKSIADRCLVMDRINHRLELLPHCLVNVDVLVVAKLGGQPRHVCRDLKVPDIIGSTLAHW